MWKNERHSSLTLPPRTKSNRLLALLLVKHKWRLNTRSYGWFRLVYNADTIFSCTDKCIMTTSITSSMREGFPRPSPLSLHSREPSDGRGWGFQVGLVAVGEDVELVHLWRGVHDHQLVLWEVGRSRHQVGDGLALHTLEVHVAALPFLLLPGHPD